jgi:mannose-6-phosphate isomerase
MNIDLNRPVRLSRAGAWRTYSGGRLIEELHGNKSAEDSNFPEEWMMSTVAARNSGREHIVEGLSMVEGADVSLAQLIESDPQACLGAAHVAKYGYSPAVLVKLLDAAERLTIQVHPTREQAKVLFDSPFGKTECWHILDGREIAGEKPCIYFGFKPDVTREQWQDIFDRQDIPAMLDCLHKIEVKTGDTFLIEGGIPHAIGAGCFLVEIQEPTDYTVRTERVTPAGLQVADFMCHQGLGFERMFDCFDFTGYTKEQVLARWRLQPRDNTLVSYEDTTMFRLETLTVDGETVLRADGKFSGICVLEGEGLVDGQAVKPGAQFFIPAACEPFAAGGQMKLIRYYGPKEDA